MTQDREITGEDGTPMALIPAGEFWMGSDGEGEKNEQPQHRVYLDAYSMDKFGVTVSRYAEFMRSTARQAPRYWDQVKLNKHSDLPVVGVDWHDAEAYCRWVGKRLPTEAEREKAARGMDGQKYPWGNEQPTISLSNFFKDFDLTQKVYKDFTQNFYDTRLAPVESNEAGKSPYGLHHMAGNVWEWTADWYDAQFYGKSPQRNPTGPSSGNDKVIRGGSWDFRPYYLRSAFRNWRPSEERDVSIGFRCARDSSK